MSQIHEKDYSLNGIRPDHILVLRDDGNVTIMLKDCGLISRFGEAPLDFKGRTERSTIVRARYEFDRAEKYPWYDPELYLGSPATRKTDVYSLCYVMQKFLDYYSLVSNRLKQCL